MAQDAIINRWNVNGNVYDIQDAGRGRPLGVATLDENGRVPYTQLPESAVEFKGYWDASTNTPTLHDGTGTKGDLYYVDVAGTQDLGSGSQVFHIGDRVLYDGLVWKNISSGSDIPVYPTIADAEADLANLEVGQIIATEEGGDSTVDAVVKGDYRAISSNAVAEFLEPKTITLVDNSNVRVVVQYMASVAVMFVYAKVQLSPSLNVSIAPYRFSSFQGAVSLLINGAVIQGETYMYPSDDQRLVVDARNGSGSGQILGFLTKQE